MIKNSLGVCLLLGLVLGTPVMGEDSMTVELSDTKQSRRQMTVYSLYNDPMQKKKASVKLGGSSKPKKARRPAFSLPQQAYVIGGASLLLIFIMVLSTFLKEEDKEDSWNG